jgi:Na+-translocating ferredoxin:NAD+ oxidoreductase subunit G
MIAPAALAPTTASSRLVATLGLGGALAGLLIVAAFQWAAPRIAEHKATVLAAAVQEVLGAPDRTEALWIHAGSLVRGLPAGVDSVGLQRVFAGYRADGSRVGFAITGGEPGFADVVSVIFGYDPSTGRILGMKVLDNKETPGLGDRIVKDTGFVAGFRGAAAPLAGVKRGAGKGAENEVDMITGATISSRTVIGIINHRLEQVGPLLERYTREGGP